MSYRDYKEEWLITGDDCFNRHVDYKYAFLSFYNDFQYKECIDVYEAFTQSYPRNIDDIYSYNPLVKDAYYWKHDVYTCLDDKFCEVVIAYFYSRSETFLKENGTELLRLMDMANDVNWNYASYSNDEKKRIAGQLDSCRFDLKYAGYFEECSNEPEEDDDLPIENEPIVEKNDQPVEPEEEKPQFEIIDPLEDFPFAELQKNDVMLLFTGMEENEQLCLDLSAKMCGLYPKLFNSHSNPGIYEKIYYVKPKEKFEGIRQLYDSIKVRKGMRKDYHGIVCLDLSEWIEHTDEFYFDVLMKYLFDHKQHGWKYLFTFGNSLKEECRELIKIVNRFFNLYLCDFRVFHDFNRFKLLFGSSLAETKFKLSDFSKEELKLIFSMVSNNMLKTVQELNTFSVFVKDLCGEENPMTKSGLELLDKYIAANETFLNNLYDKSEMDRIKILYEKLKTSCKGDENVGK